MQRHGGLAGARPPLHHEGTGQFRADHPILFRLKGFDDVPHSPGAVGGERRQQRALPGDGGQVIAAGGHRGGQGVGVQHLVVQRGDRAAAQREMTPAQHAVRRGSRGLIEGGRRGRPPVEQQLVPLVVREAETADVAADPLDQVEAAEGQSILDGA